MGGLEQGKIVLGQKDFFVDSTILSLTVFPRGKPSFGANHFVGTCFRSKSLLLKLGFAKNHFC